MHTSRSTVAGRISPYLRTKRLGLVVELRDSPPPFVKSNTSLLPSPTCSMVSTTTISCMAWHGIASHRIAPFNTPLPTLHVMGTHRSRQKWSQEDGGAAMKVKEQGWGKCVM